MASARSEPSARSERPGSGRPDVPCPPALKILVSGGRGVGKTTLIRAVSGRARVLRTEVPPWQASLTTVRGGPVSAREGGPPTVSTDFGRITVGPGVPLYLFGAPAREPFWFLWDEFARGALGAVLLADTRELDLCFPAADRFERLGVPFLVAVNCFPLVRSHPAREVARALDLEYGTPVVLLDARDRDAGKEALVRLIEYAARRHHTPFLDGTTVTRATRV